MTTPPVQTINASDVGSLYHVGFGYSDPTADQFGNTGFKSYGYMLVNQQPYVKKVNVQAQGQLIQASPNLTDRDLVVYPRVNDGDFSGGGLQQIFENPQKFFDGNLSIREPGAVRLNPRWFMNVDVGTMTARGTGNPQVVTFQNKAVWTYNQTNGNLYQLSGTITGPGFTPNYIDTDGLYIYATDGNNNLSRWDGSAWTSISTTLASAVPTGIGGAHTQIWAINQGTAGHFIYFAEGTNSATLARWDLALNTGIGLPMGSNNFTIVDLCEYGGAVALVTNDAGGGPGMNVWYHDGNNLQLILRLDGFSATGICNCLGNLFVTINPTGNDDTPALIQIGGSTFNVVAKPALPITQPATTNVQLGAPTASGQTIAFPVLNPNIFGSDGSAVGAVPYFGIYDVLTQAYTHLATQGGLDQPGTNPRNSTYLGHLLYSPQLRTGPPLSGTMQYQKSRVAGVITYQPTGTIISSRFDFNTPGIGKLFRRVIAHHAPLNAGESISLGAFINIDPTVILIGSGQATATVTNSTVGSTTTVLVLPQHTTGFSMAFSVTLNAGTNGATTPTLFYVTTEVTVPWVWEMTLDCTSKRKILGNLDDPQGLRGQDLFWLLHNAWELAQPLTMYSAEGVTYTVEIQDFESTSVSPQIGRVDPTKEQDFESHVRLRISESII